MLGAGLVVAALTGLVQEIATLVNLPLYRLESIGVGWVNIGIALILLVALLWAGFAMVSRRPSRRLAVTVIFALGTLHQIYAVVTVILAAHYAGLSVSTFALSVFWLALWVGALAYMIATRHDPDLRPRRAIAPVQTAPAGTHRPIAPKIADGPGWHEALLASLHATGTPETPPRRAWPWVILLIVILLLARLLGEGVDQGMTAIGIDATWQILIWLIYGFISILVLSFPIASIRRRMLQTRARNAEAALQRAETKRPIFYLRSFALDAEVGRPSVLELLFNFQPANPEQLMTNIARKCGPVIAIGRPGERLPALGAARFYVINELWQEKVADVATVAQLVIWASGTTEGLQWEITHLISTLPPEKLVLWAHPYLLDLDADERETEWSAFVTGLGTLFPKPLPKPLGSTRFFAFDHDFTPIPFGSKRWTQGGALLSSLRKLLRAKGIPPYDPARVKRRRLIGRIAFGTVGAVIAAFVIGAAYLFWDYVHAAPPVPLDWNLLGSDLYTDEIFVTPPNPQEVIDKLTATVGQLDGHWFGANWEHVPPGRLPPLKVAAQHYLAVFQAAHADPTVEGRFYGTRSTLIIDAATPAAAGAFVAKIAPVRAALGIVDNDWSAIKADTTGWHYADKIRALVTAREQLLDAETALLTLLANHPTAWTSARDASGAVKLRFSDASVLAQAQALAKQDDAAATALKAALNPN